MGVNMNFTNAQTALVYEWIDSTIYVQAIYDECKAVERFEEKIAEEADAVWKKLHPDKDCLTEEFCPLFWDEIADAFTAKFRQLWQKSGNFLTTTR